MCLVYMCKAWWAFSFWRLSVELWFHNMLSVYVHKGASEVTQDSVAHLHR